MKKIAKIIAAILITFGCQFAAQAAGNRHLSIRASYDMTTSTRMSELCSLGSGASLGIVYHYTFCKNFFFEAGPHFIYNTIGFDTAKKPGIVKKKYDGYLYDVGIKLPIDFGYKFHITPVVDLGLYTGPALYFNIATRGKFITDYSETRETVKLPNSGVDMAWNLGVYTDIANRWHVGVEGTYGFSYLCLLNYSIPATNAQPPSFRRAGLSIVLGYNF